MDDVICTKKDSLRFFSEIDNNSVASHFQEIVDDITKFIQIISLNNIRLPILPASNIAIGRSTIKILLREIS